MEIIPEGKIPGAKGTLLLSQTELKQKVKCICKISTNGHTFGTGFFCKIPYEGELIPVLITNYHIIDDNFMKKKKQLIIYIDDEMKQLNINNRKIYSSEKNKYDIMIIKLKEEDEIYNYLEIDQNIFKNNSENLFRYEPIYILHFPNFKEASVSYGKGIEIESDYNIKHYCNTDNGSSGGPILNSATDKIIGIHKGFIGIKNWQFNIGTYLKYPLIDLNNNLNNNISYHYSLNQNGIYGSFKAQEIFQSEDFNSLGAYEFANKIRNATDYSELKRLKELHTDVIMGCRLRPKDLDSRGNRISCWSMNEKRGNKPYYPPIGWIGIGLKVKGKYYNDAWIGNNNSQGEWCVAYQGIGGGQSSDLVKTSIGFILNQGFFRMAYRQAHEYCSDQYHPGEMVGKGVYFTPYPKIAEEFAGISEINGIQYKTILMVRVKPDAIRSCSDGKDYWVVNGTTDEVRPYRILYKEC